MSKLVGVEGLEDSQTPENFEKYFIHNLLNNDWRKTIINFLENPIKTTNRKIKYKVLSYVIIAAISYSRRLKFLGENEAYLTILEVHSGSCGSHHIG